MENKINVAELLRKCPEGMELDCTLFSKPLKYSGLECPKDIFPIRTVAENGEIIWFTKEGCIYNNMYSKCVIFPKGKNTWAGFVPPFNDGDIVATNSGTWIGIVEKQESDIAMTTHCVLKDTGDFEAYLEEKGRWCFSRLATEDEKQRLFKVIEDNGYKWDVEKKCLLKLKFKDGDIVAAPIFTGGTWIGIFKQYENTTFEVYCSLTSAGKFNYTSSKRHILEGTHLATEKEKEKFLQVIKMHGYKWNAETKVLKKLIEPKFKVGDRIKHVVGREEVATVVGVEDTHYNLDSKGGTSSFTISLQREWELVPNKFDINTLKPFDKVLVRDSIINKWHIQFFDRFDGTRSFPFFCVGNVYNQCIPYKGNEHLLGTKDECSNYYKIWE